MITVDIPKGQLKKIRKNFDELEKLSRDECLKAVTLATVNGHRYAVKNLIENKSDFTGFTRKSIVHSVDANKLEGTVAVNNETYGAVVEYGVPPQYVFPPFGKGSQLAQWAKKKLGVSDKESGSVSFLIARKIWERGRAPKPFMRPAMKRAFDFYSRSLAQRLNRTIKRIN